MKRTLAGKRVAHISEGVARRRRIALQAIAAERVRRSSLSTAARRSEGCRTDFSIANAALQRAKLLVYESVESLKSDKWRASLQQTAVSVKAKRVGAGLAGAASGRIADCIALGATALTHYCDFRLSSEDGKSYRLRELRSKVLPRNAEIFLNEYARLESLRYNVKLGRSQNRIAPAAAQLFVRAVKQRIGRRQHIRRKQLHGIGNARTLSCWSEAFTLEAEFGNFVFLVHLLARDEQVLRGLAWAIERKLLHLDDTVGFVRALLEQLPWLCLAVYNSSVTTESLKFSIPDEVKDASHCDLENLVAINRFKKLWKFVLAGVENLLVCAHRLALVSEIALRKVTKALGNTKDPKSHDDFQDAVCEYKQFLPSKGKSYTGKNFHVMIHAMVSFVTSYAISRSDAKAQQEGQLRIVRFTNARCRPESWYIGVAKTMNEMSAYSDFCHWPIECRLCDDQTSPGISLMWVQHQSCKEQSVAMGGNGVDSGYARRTRRPALNCDRLYELTVPNATVAEFRGALIALAGARQLVEGMCVMDIYGYSSDESST